ncbi:MAG TPA: hypothetical protein VGM56_19280, partial [Byssovorax sp.]
MLALFALVLALVGAPREARAWVEAHVEQDDARVTLEPDGSAHVEHTITLKIAGGPLRTLDLRGVDDDAAPDAEAVVMAEKEGHGAKVAGPAAVELMPPDKLDPAKADAPVVGRTLRLRFAERGLSRGLYKLRVRYATSFAARIERTGRSARVRFRGLAWADDGLDNARVTFDLPSAPNPPRGDDGARPVDAPIGPPTGAVGQDGAGHGDVSLVLTSLKRGAGRDEIELLRPYVPRGESVTWAIEADALAFAALTAPPKPAPKSLRARVAERFGDAAQRGAGLAIAGALFSVF